MAELNKKKKKHDHKLTDWLKIIIFGLVMIAPFFAILVPCVYVSFNPNAKDSYTNNAIESKIVIDQTANAVNGVTYIFNANTDYGAGSSTNGLLWTYSSVNFHTAFGVADRNYSGMNIANNGKFNLLYYDSNNNLTVQYLNVDVTDTRLVGMSIIFDRFSSTTNYSFNYFRLIQYVYKQETLDNAFTYAVNQMVESPVFNWTQQTGMYNVINSMTSDLEMSSGGNIIATLLTYWSLNIAIYIIFDIIFWAFTKITHFLNE